MSVDQQRFWLTQFSNVIINNIYGFWMECYLKVLKLFWSTALAAELEYRVNFLISAVSSFGGLIGSIFGLFLFYQNDYIFPGWSWNQSLIVLGVFTLLQEFSATFLAPNLNRIVHHIQQGTLDFVLLKPISSQFWLSTHTLSPWEYQIYYLEDLSLAMQAISWACRSTFIG